MKHFRIAVNGTSYDVEVTELDGAVSAAAAPVSTPPLLPLRPRLPPPLVTAPRSPPP